MRSFDALCLFPEAGVYSIMATAEWYFAMLPALRMAFHALRPISASAYSQKGLIFDMICESPQRIDV